MPITRTGKHTTPGAVNDQGEESDSSDSSPEEAPQKEKLQTPKSPAPSTPQKASSAAKKKASTGKRSSAKRSRSGAASSGSKSSKKAKTKGTPRSPRVKPEDRVGRPGATDATQEYISKKVFQTHYRPRNKNGKRKTPVKWTESEIVAIQLGVAEFGKKWTKILEKYRTEFHVSRTSVDVKDKFRSMERKQVRNGGTVAAMISRRRPRKKKKKKSSTAASAAPVTQPDMEEQEDEEEFPYFDVRTRIHFDQLTARLTVPCEETLQACLQYAYTEWGKKDQIPARLSAHMLRLGQIGVFATNSEQITVEKQLIDIMKDIDMPLEAGKLHLYVRPIKGAKAEAQRSQVI